MNAREFNGYKERFVNKTGMELWTAVERYGLSLGFFFNSYDDLIELSMTDEKGFDNLIIGIENHLTKKESTISDKRIIYALAVSLFNTHIDSKRKRIEECYVSSIFLSQEEAKDIISKYGQIMSNPIGFIVEPDRIYLSILNGRNLNQPLTYTKNGKRNRPRPKGGLSSKTQYNLLEIEYIDVDAYHPTLWYLLRKGIIQNYSHLFPNALKLCKKWIGNSIQRRRKILDESNSTSTTRISTIQ